MCTGSCWLPTDPTYNKNWRQFYSPVPCQRDYFGAPIGEWTDNRWFNAHFYTVANNSMYMGGEEYRQLVYEYCSHDYKSNADYKGAVLAQSLPYGDSGLQRRYMKVDFVKAVGYDDATHDAYWTYSADKFMKELRRYTDIINWLNIFILGNGVKLEYTDPS